MTTDELIVGYIRRSHGVRGELVVRLTSNREERVAPGAELLTDDGPLVIESSRPHSGDFLVRFVGVDGREKADDLKGTELRAHPIAADPDELWVHELIGATVTDQLGVVRGTVVEVHENPASDILALDSEALVPVRFITEHSAGAITVDVPDGLFEVYES